MTAVANPIPRCGLWHTHTLSELQDIINSMPSRQRAEAYDIFMLTLNACNKAVEDEILSKEIFCW
jgi:hypothetical protein